MEGVGAACLQFQSRIAGVGWPGSAGAVSSRFRLCCGCGHVTLGVGSHVVQDFARSSAHKALVAGDTALYCSLTTLARALAQYLLAASKLPGHLHLPPEREGDIMKFVVMVLEVGWAGEGREGDHHTPCAAFPDPELL